MKFKLISIMFILLIASLACTFSGGRSPTPDLNATVGVSLQQTVAAQQPTATQEPTPAPTATPEPTPTIAPSPTPQAVATEEGKTYSMTEGADGWTNYLYQELGFSISLPPKWALLDLNSGDVETMLSAASETNPELASLFSSSYLTNMVAAGIRLIAVDTDADSLTAGVSTNLNVLVLDLPFVMTMEDYIEVNKEQIISMLGQETLINQQTVMLGNVEAEMFEYEAVLNDVYGNPHSVTFQQYLLLDGKTQYILTITSTKENFNRNATLFAGIASSFNLVK